MGFLRKAAIVSTGGMARAAINPNSKKARTAKANEKMLKLQRAEAKREAAAQRQATSAAQRTTSLPAAPATVASVDAPSQPAVAGLARAAMSVADELEKLAALRDSDVLTAEEFDTQKAKILNSAPRQP